MFSARYLRARPAVLALALVALAVLIWPAAAQAQQRCREVGSATRPVGDPLVRQIATPNGPFRFRMARWGGRCETYWGNERGVGLMDEAGRRVLVPASYWSVTPLNDTTALVRRSVADPTNYFYEYGVGERGPSPYFRATLGGPGDNAITMPVAWGSNAELGPRSVFFWTGAAEPVETPNTTAFDITELRDENGVVSGYVYLHHFTAADGQEVSRIFDLSMRPISPVIGRVENWRIVSPADTQPRGGNRSPYNLVSRSMQFDHPHLPGPGLYIPITADGTPMPLPEGAVGVIPLRVQNLAYARGLLVRDHAVGWAIVYASTEGFEVAVGHGTLTQVVEQAASAPRYTGMRRFHVLSNGSNPIPMLDTTFVRDAPGWRAVNSLSLQPIAVVEPGQTFVDPEDGYEAVRAAYREAARQQIADEAARNAAAREAIRQQLQAQAERHAQARAAGVRTWEEIQAGRRELCSPSMRAEYLPEAGISRYLRECDVSEALVAALAHSSAPHLAAAARARANETAQHRERERFFGGPQAEADPWARGLAAAQAAADESYNAFLQQQNDVYMRNLEAWNSGAQNWRYERY